MGFARGGGHATARGLVWISGCVGSTGLRVGGLFRARAIGMGRVFVCGRLVSLAALALAWCFVLGPAAFAARSDVVVGMAIEPQGLDPTAAAPVAIGQVTWQNIYQGLVRIDRDGKVQPQLAERWTVSDDGRTYTFALREGVKFHNGEAFDASTAKFALDRARGANSTNPQKQFFSVIDTVTAQDPATLVVTLKEPAGNLLYWLGWPASVMVEPKSAQVNRTEPVGTGPFKFARWAKGDRIVLERNPNYWNTAQPVRIQRATFRFIGDPQAQAAALRAGDVDAFPEFGAPELYGNFQKDARFTTLVGNTELKVVAGMNNQRKPFDDKRVRQALMLAIDRPLLIEGAWSGLGQAIGSHYTPNDPGFIDLTGVYPADKAKARRLLSEAGYPNGFSFTIKVPQMSYATRSAEVLQAMLAEIGVTMTIVPTEFPAKWVSEVMTGHDFDMTIVAHAEPMDISIYARPDYYFGYRNAAFNDTIRRAEQTTDQEGRLKLYGEAQTMLAEDVPALFLFVMPKLGIWDRKLKGLWANEPIPSNDLTEVVWED
ncbi:MULTISPECIES: ABC transporter substrate-binding protein [unclassified Chelatococcus]|jgi:peptide/nickel transport system substrate-binding protein|uniref:ABC transporter substrate-binding protein n=2 Tax=Chelatococcus TaxID=28209 RepID=UPI0020BF2D23|nr:MULTISPECIES: ABC transporter substrate-binding protein [unclassified Chelatococcus]MCO5075063.1 ABC transporter substrate-binding protein [Chelatococcus sp.]CAH1658514.1 Peptide/nickel transport system substrate-binding protein [Hyphomicrobiales bacterium]CAH1689875.1 Peptide/nickel transport system substrate-binding protein [Hyphomicrobiales bacterium]